MQKLGAAIDLLGKKIISIVILSLIIGVFLFLVEYLFIFSIQGFLVSIGVTTAQNLTLPQWLPIDSKYFYLIFLAVGISRVILMQLKIYVSRLSNQYFISKFREEIMSSAISQASYFSTHETFSLFSDTLSRAGSVVIEGTSLVITIISTIMLMVTAFIKAPHEMTFGMLSFLIIAWPLKKLSRKSQAAGTNLSLSWEQTTKILFEGMRHFFFLKSHDLINQQINKGIKQIGVYEDNYKTYFKVSMLKNILPQALGIIILIVLSYVGKNIYHTSAANLLTFLYLFLRISQSGSEVFGTLGNLLFNASSFVELKKWRDFAKENELKQSKQNSESFVKINNIESIEFNHIDFSYSDEPLLKNIYFKLNKGDVLHIDAPSGSGKSTVIALMLKTLTPNKGDILFNNKNLLSIRDDFRDKIAFVGPEPFIFNDTIKANLLSGIKTNVSDNQIWEVLNKVSLDQLIYSYPNKLNELLYEHTQLSTGQKQRLSLARAILRNPDLLILDEATANLDLEVELTIKKHLQEFLKEKICVIVSHKGLLKELANQTLKL